MVNLLTLRTYSTLLCPLGNTFYLWAIPMFGLVYFRELAQQKQAAEEALRAYRDQLEELVTTRTQALTAANKHAAAMEERQRIAADMHDGLAQTLSYLGLATDRAEDFLEDGKLTDATGELYRIQSALSQATNDVRRTIANLQRQTPPRQSLQDALQQLAKTKAGLGEPEISVVDDQIAPLLLPGEDLEQVVRIVQEALTNARRHSRAEHIEVKLERSTDGYRVIVTDNGIGFEPDAPCIDTRDHFGLSIMNARAAQISGQLTVDSQPGQGTRLTVTWPDHISWRPAIPCAPASKAITT